MDTRFRADKRGAFLWLNVLTLAVGAALYVTVWLEQHAHEAESAVTRLASPAVVASHPPCEMRSAIDP
ncbi:MAG: hypothetical protein AB7L71_02455 [Vicinamibacterales bacterium]